MHAVLPFGSCRSLPSCHMTTDRDFGLQSHGHQIPSHPEADWIAEVIPLHAADRDDGEPLGCRLEDEPGEIHHGKAHVDLAERSWRRACTHGSPKHTGDQQAGRAADQPIDHSIDPRRITRDVERRYENGRDCSLNSADSSTVQQHGGCHRQRDDDSDLPCPRTDFGNQQISDADSDDDSGDQFDGATHSLAQREAEAHDGSNRREERNTVAGDMNGDQPGESGSGCGLGDGQGRASPAPQSVPERRAGG